MVMERESSKDQNIANLDKLKDGKMPYLENVTKEQFESQKKYCKTKTLKLSQKQKIYLQVVLL